MTYWRRRVTGLRRTMMSLSHSTTCNAVQADSPRSNLLMPGSDIGVHRRLVWVSGQPDPASEWWTTSDVAAYLGLKVAMVSAYRTRGQMPQPDMTVGRTHVWRPAPQSFSGIVRGSALAWVADP